MQVPPTATTAASHIGNTGPELFGPNWQSPKKVSKLTAATEDINRLPDIIILLRLLGDRSGEILF